MTSQSNVSLMKGKNALKFPGQVNLEDKLDEDFLYFFGFIKIYYDFITEPHDVELMKAWLRVLCSTQPIGVDAKRVRNIYLTNLLLNMQGKQLLLPFTRPPPEGDLPCPDGVFAPPMPNFRLEEPRWLKELIDEQNKTNVNITHHSKDGRTYLATKALENGNGAVGYIAVSLQDEEIKGDGDGAEECDDDEDEVDDSGEDHESSIKKLLAQRPTEAERNRLKRFYADITESITQELDGKGKANDHANLLMTKLEQNLRCDGEMENLWGMEEDDRRKHLLMVIREKVEKRMQEVKQREESLNEVEKAMMPRGPASQFEHRTVGGVWRQICATNFSGCVLAELKSSYPKCVVVRFLQLLIAERMKSVQTFKQQLIDFEIEVTKDYREELEGFVTTYKQARNEYLETAPVVIAVCQFRKEERERRRLEEEERKKRMDEGAKTTEETEHKHVMELMKELECTKTGIQVHENEVRHLQVEIEKQNDVLREANRKNKKMGEHHEREMHCMDLQMRKLQQEIECQDHNMSIIKKMIEQKP